MSAKWYYMHEDSYYKTIEMDKVKVVENARLENKELRRQDKSL